MSQTIQLKWFIAIVVLVFSAPGAGTQVVRQMVAEPVVDVQV